MTAQSGGRPVRGRWPADRGVRPTEAGALREVEAFGARHRPARQPCRRAAPRTRPASTGDTASSGGTRSPMRPRGTKRIAALDLGSSAGPLWRTTSGEYNTSATALERTERLGPPKHAGECPAGAGRRAYAEPAGLWALVAPLAALKRRHGGLFRSVGDGRAPSRGSSSAPACSAESTRRPDLRPRVPDRPNGRSDGLAPPLGGPPPPRPVVPAVGAAARGAADDHPPTSDCDADPG